jgi:basic membrane protein A
MRAPSKIASVFVLALLAAACSPTSKLGGGEAPAASGQAPKARAALILQGTHDDGTWNAMAWEGFQQLKAQGIEIAYSESVMDVDVARVLRNYASNGYTFIWAHSGTYPNAVMEVAKDFPDVTFAAVTGPGLEYPPNVWQVTHEWEDAYFLAGALAGLMSKTGVVGNVGGIPIPIYAASHVAFNQGVKHVRPDATTFDPVFIGDFNDSVGAKKAAQAQIDAGADIIISSLDAGAFGLIEGAREANKAGKSVRVMTILSDLYDQATDVVYSSAYMDYPGAVTDVAAKVIAGEKGGYYPMNWSNGHARWADLHGQVPDDVLAKLKVIEGDIKAGKIDVFTQADLTN